MSPRLKILVAVIMTLAAPAFGQSVQQSGTVTIGHVPYWVTNGVIGDGGSAAAGNITSIGVTNNGASGICINSAPVSSGAYNELCLGAQTTGPGIISLQNYGSATAQGLQFLINGSQVTIPTGGGNTFPTIIAPLVIGDAICANNTAGVLKDCGAALGAGTQWGVPYYSTTAILASTGAGTNGQVFLGQTGAPPNWGTVSGDASISTSGVITIGAGAVTLAKQANAPSYSLEGNFTGSSSVAPQFSTIGSLTQKASPAGTDLVLIQDQAASGALKYALVSAVGSAGSVASVNTLTGNVTLITQPQGRFTLQSVTPVMTTTQSGKGTLYYDCYAGGNQVPYYTGSAIAMDTITSCEVSAGMISAASAGQVVTGNVYDLWWAGHTICVAMSSSTGGGGGWASDSGGSITSRGTGFSQLAGPSSTVPFLTNANSISNCFNGSTNKGPISANQATYLATFYATGNGQTSFTLGASASGGTAGLIGIWNYYNRVSLPVSVVDNGSGYSYNSTTIRQARGGTGMQIQLVIGVSEEAVDARDNSRIATAATALATAETGIGLDSTNSFQCEPSVLAINTNVSLALGSPSFCSFLPGVGLHTISANEAADANNSSFNQFSSHVLSTTSRY